MPQPLYPQGKAAGTHWIGGWVVPRASLDMVVKRTIPGPHMIHIFFMKFYDGFTFVAASECGIK
jgi:hypothetical protein